MEERRALGFRQRPAFKDVLAYIEEGEPLNLPQPNRRASTYVQSHFYLDDLPQSTEPLDENPRPHTALGQQLEEDFASADDGYQGRPFPQLRRPTFLGPGPDTESESGPDEAFHRDGFDAPRPPQPQSSSSVSGRLGEAALSGGAAIVAAGAAGIGRAAEQFGFRNAERAAAALEQRIAPQIIGRPSEAEAVIRQAGQRAQQVEQAAAQDIEQFAAEQAAAETAEITPLLAESGAATAAAAETGFAASALEALAGAAGTVLAPEVAIPAAFGLVAGAGGALFSEAGTQTEPPPGSRDAAAAGGVLEGARAGASAFPTARGLGRVGGAAVGGVSAAALGLGMGAVGGAYEGARYMLGGANGGDAARSSSSDVPDVRTLNGMQQGTPQERFTLRQPRIQQPMVSRMDVDSDDAPMAQQQAQPRPQVQSRPARQPRMPFGLNQISPPSSSSDRSAPRQTARPQRPEPSFNELRREALARSPEAA